MFAPVVEGGAPRARGRRGRGRPRRGDRRGRDRAGAAGVPGDRDRPARRGRAAGDARPRHARAAGRRAGGARRGGGAARRAPSGRCCGSAAARATRRAAVRALAERLAAPVLTTYGAAGVLPPGHPCLVGLPPHVPAAGRLWDEADVVVAIGSDLDGVQTQNFAQPQPPTLIAVNLEPTRQELPRRHLLAGDAGDGRAPRWPSA